MAITLVNERQKKGKELRMCVVETLQELIYENPKVVALEADLGGASGFLNIQKSHPNNFIQCGIAEANMMGVAAGLSLVNMIPFVHTFAPFASRRVYDQVYLSGGYANNTINIYGSDPGFCVGPNGGTHTSFEDIALMRAIPNAIVCDAADEVQLRFIIKAFASLKGVHYVRANRKDVRHIYTEDSSFALGKGNVLVEGDDVLIVACGQLVSDALDCKEELAKENISATVIDMFTIKPLDHELLLAHCHGKKAVVTFENHSIIGGLGSAVAEVLAENGVATKFKRIGVNDYFGQVGTPEYLQKAFHLTANDLKESIVTLLNK